MVAVGSFHNIFASEGGYRQPPASWDRWRRACARQNVGNKTTLGSARKHKEREGAPANQGAAGNARERPGAQEAPGRARKRQGATGSARERLGIDGGGLVRAKM